MTLHPRTQKVNLARAEIKMALAKLYQAHDLTFGEITSILADEAMSIAKFMIRMERHGNASMEGDLAQSNNGQNSDH